MLVPQQSSRRKELPLIKPHQWLKIEKWKLVKSKNRSFSNTTPFEGVGLVQVKNEGQRPNHKLLRNNFFCPFYRVFRIGTSDWKLSKVCSCRTESVRFWPYVGKSKMRLRGSRFFQSLKIWLQFSAVCLQLSKKSTYHLSNAFWLYKHRVKSAPIQLYSHLLLTIFNRNAL